MKERLAAEHSHHNTEEVKDKEKRVSLPSISDFDDIQLFLVSLAEDQFKSS